MQIDSQTTIDVIKAQARDGVGLGAPPCSAFYIVNGFDRPCERLIAERRADGLLYYVHPELRYQKWYHGMSAEEAVPVEDFGIQLSIEDGMLHGIQIYGSRAIYSDGRVRRWQGSSRFRVPLPNVKDQAPAIAGCLHPLVSPWLVVERSFVVP